MLLINDNHMLLSNNRPILSPVEGVKNHNILIFYTLQ